MGKSTSQYWASQSTEGRELPRTKRERVVRYYSTCISAALSAMDDGRPAQDDEDKPAKIPSRTYIEFVLAALGFDVQDWTRTGDDEIVRLNTCHVRQTDDAGHKAALRRFVRQRERLNEWQGESGNPILIEHRVVYDQDTRRNYSEYRIPFGELLRDIIDDAPVGTNQHHLKPVVKRHVRTYLKRFEGAAKPVHRTRHPSPMSDANRSATLARKAFEGEERKAGPASAVNLVRASFKAAFGDKFSEIFRPDSETDNSQQTQDLGDIPVCHICHQPIRTQPPINPTTCGENGRAENFDAEDGRRRVSI